MKGSKRTHSQAWNTEMYHVSKKSKVEFYVCWWCFLKKIYNSWARWKIFFFFFFSHLTFFALFPFFTPIGFKKGKFMMLFSDSAFMLRHKNFLTIKGGLFWFLGFMTLDVYFPKCSSESFFLVYAEITFNLLLFLAATRQILSQIEDLYAKALSLF